jgi:hypothetical protein
MLFATQLILGINVGLTIEPLAQPTATNLKYWSATALAVACKTAKAVLLQ